MSDRTPADCGHKCCDERSDPLHDHFLTPEDCPGCAAASDRTPADVIAEWSRLTPDVAYSMLSDEAVASEILRTLAAAGFRVVPIPDDNARRQRRADVRLLQSWAALFRYNAGSGLTERISVADQRTLVGVIDRLAAALLDGQPEDRPAQCPTCGSDDPAKQRVRGPGQRHCPDSWHVGGSGDTR